MKDSENDPQGLELDAVRKKYLRERDKRLVEGRAAIRDLRADRHFADYRRDPFTEYEERDAVSDDVDVAIIGGGMAGIVAGAQLRKAGVRRIRIIDEAGGIGGTWYWNRYPGVMCDIESYTYLPMLEDRDYIPRNRYAFGDEILGHFEALAAKFDLVADALFHTRVDRSEWDERSLRWSIRTDHGDEITAKYVVMAVGILNLMKLPVIPGMELFRGRAFHTARWDYDYTGGNLHGGLHKLADKVVGVVGTGASAIQCIPHLAEGSKKLFVFQRTPSAIGVRDNRPTEEDFAKDLRPGWQRERMENFQAIILGVPVESDLVDDGWTHHFGPVHTYPRDPAWSSEEYGRRLEEFDLEIMEAHRRRVEETVDDAATANTLKPYYRYICRRPCFHDEYLPAFNAANVELIDCPAGIECVTENGLVIGEREFELDCIVYATGFEAETTPFFRRAGHEIVGRGEVLLAEKWKDGPRTLFGMMSRSFPNMFIMPSPGQQAVVTVNHALITVEVAEHVAATVARLEEKGVAAFDVSQEAEADWCETILSTHVDSSPVMSLCTPSRINNEGNPGATSPLAGSYRGGFGDFFGFKKLLADWRASGELAGLELQSGAGS
ncbi:MAG: NAD(P)/FAD-dependent oxidoreductase [Myxococcota bacterium]|nr:NAD(P)/FAD-dependent oxidoreductase [Myxococcota bacterium]